MATRRIKRKQSKKRNTNRRRGGANQSEQFVLSEYDDWVYTFTCGQVLYNGKKESVGTIMGVDIKLSDIIYMLSLIHI